MVPCWEGLWSDAQQIRACQGKVGQYGMRGLFCRGGENEPSAPGWVSSCTHVPFLNTHGTDFLCRLRISRHLVVVEPVSLSGSPCSLPSSPEKGPFLPLLTSWTCPRNAAGILLVPACPGVFWTAQIARVSLWLNPIKSWL